jgi:hypothetical protein
MDIKLPVNLLNSSAVTKLTENPLGLKVGQKLDVKVISSLIKTQANAFALQLANLTLNVQSNQALKLIPGQALQIQVTKVSPALEFAIIISLPDPKAPAIPPDVRLKLIAPAIDKQPAESATELSLPINQPLPAKIIALTSTRIQLQVFTGTLTLPRQENALEPASAKPYILVTIDRSQLLATQTNTHSAALTTLSAQGKAPADFKLGQPVLLEISSTGTKQNYKISFAQPADLEGNVTEFIKQFLPKHEASPVLLNQLIKELPQWLKNQSVSETLQKVAAQILQNLPQRQQLNDSAGLKQALVNSGLFLEAKTTELNKNPELALDQDFKANLLKFIDNLKKELATPEKNTAEATGLDTLKSLQQKTEGNLAKLSLDQLVSLPKEDNPKQVWTIDLPFVERGNAETVTMQIEREKDTNPQTPENENWSVMITMNPPGLGTIQCKLAFHNETINTYFRSREPETTELISHHLDHLKNQLEAAGLKPGVLNIQSGLQPTQSNYQLTKNALFDENA